ncbi:hypothetical protein GXW82_44480 [Streptacidiphilus sp. 4-A2]|nr:hypothetical protein [Streptacidiphilus sp. 4-A2]
MIFDELQNFLLAAQTIRSGTRPNDPSYATLTREALTTLNRQNSSQGGICTAIVHRPGPDSPVTPDLRDAFAGRVSYRVKGIDSARNVLGPDAVADGAAPHDLLEVHKGVAVVELGEDGGHYTLKADMITLEEFDGICTRGRLLRKEAGKLVGYAAESAEAEQADTTAARCRVGRRGDRAAGARAAAETWPRHGPHLPRPLRRAHRPAPGRAAARGRGGGTVKLPRQADGSAPTATAWTPSRPCCGAGPPRTRPGPAAEPPDQAG